MAYTGTGTEQDPYLVDNLTDFLTCIAISDAYVKVIDDIDASNDENYDIELDSYISFRCTECYADEPKTIRGIVVRSIYFIQTGKINRIENLFFVDCEHKKTADYATINMPYTGTLFINCGFSMRILEYGNRPFFSQAGSSSAVHFENCAFDIDFLYSGVNSNNNNVMSSCNLYKCNVILRNARLSQNYIIYKANYTSLILYNATPLISVNVSAYPIITAFYSASYSYIAVIGWTATPSDSELLDVRYAGGASGMQHVLAYCTKDSEEDDVGKFTAYTPMSKLTAEQLRNNEYLTQIGFIP